MGAMTFAYTPRVTEGIPVMKAHLLVSLEDIFNGTSVSLQVKAQEVCSACGGSCRAHPDAKKTCPVCGGRGTHADVSSAASTEGEGGGMRFQHAVRTRCARCKGEGIVVTEPCPHCQGVGTTPRIKSVNVTIPAGWPNVSISSMLLHDLLLKLFAFSHRVTLLNSTRAAIRTGLAFQASWRFSSLTGHMMYSLCTQNPATSWQMSRYLS